MSVSVSNTPETYLEVFYDEAQLPDRETGPIFRIETGQLKPREQDYKLILRVKSDDSLIPYFKNAELEEHYTEEVKKPIKKDPVKPAPKPEGQAEGQSMEQEGQPAQEGKMEEEAAPAEPEYEIKKVKKTRVTQVKVTDRTPYTYSFDLIKQFQQVEKQHAERDAEILATNTARNDLESLIYSSRSACDGEWAEFAAPQDKQVIQSTSSQLETWIYGEGEDQKKEVYLEKLGQLKQLTKPITERITAFQKVAEATTYL